MQVVRLASSFKMSHEMREHSGFVRKPCHLAWSLRIKGHRFLLPPSTVANHIVHSFSFSPSPLAFATPPFFSCNRCRSLGYRFVRCQRQCQKSPIELVGIFKSLVDILRLACGPVNSDLQRLQSAVCSAREMAAKQRADMAECQNELHWYST